MAKKDPTSTIEIGPQQPNSPVYRPFYSIALLFLSVSKPIVAARSAIALSALQLLRFTAFQMSVDLFLLLSLSSKDSLDYHTAYVAVRNGRTCYTVHRPILMQIAFFSDRARASFCESDPKSL